jgi:hypothetical protein
MSAEDLPFLLPLIGALLKVGAVRFLFSQNRVVERQLDLRGHKNVMQSQPKDHLSLGMAPVDVRIAVALSLSRCQMASEFFLSSGTRLSANNPENGRYPSPRLPTYSLA